MRNDSYIYIGWGLLEFEMFEELFKENDDE